MHVVLVCIAPTALDLTVLIPRAVVSKSWQVHLHMVGLLHKISPTGYCWGDDVALQMKLVVVKAAQLPANCF